MEEKRVSITDGAIRQAVQTLGADGKEVSYPLLYEALGAEITERPDGLPDYAKDVIRARISSMAKHGEITRTERGSFVYNFKRKPRQARIHGVIWRFVRAAKPEWSISDCSLMTRASYTYALRYITWLEQEGYVERCGKGKNNTTLYRNTSLARKTPETPYPPCKDTDPFEKERLAAATIARLMLCANPYALKTAKDIVAAAKILLTRFEGTIADFSAKSREHLRNENNFSEDNCDAE